MNLESSNTETHITSAEGIKLSAWDKFLLFIKQPIAITIITAAVSFSTAYLTFAVNDKNATINFEDIGAKNFQQLFDLQSKQIADLTTKVEKLSEENNKLRNEIADMKLAQYRSNQNSILFNNSIDAFPFPYWVKSREGRMIKLNQAYEDQYLKPRGLTRLDYLDKTDYEVWDQETALSFREADQRVAQLKKKVLVVEEVTINGKREMILVTKFPIFLNQDVIGVAGFALPRKFITKNYKELLDEINKEL